MALIRWNPIRTSRELYPYRSDVDRLFDEFFTPSTDASELSTVISPPVDIEETEDAFVFRADLPGIDPKAVKVKMTGDVLRISGERKREVESKGTRRVERVYGTFERSFTLGTPVRGDQVVASYRDGVLEVKVPKAEEARAREIEVHVG